MNPTADPQYALTPSGNLRRRLFVSRLFAAATVGAAGLAVAILGILVVYAASEGVSQFSLTFFTGTLPGYDGQGGGLGPAVVGTLELALGSTVIALPIGVMTGLYVTEFAKPRRGRALQTAIELMAGLPSIVIGVFIAALIVDNWQESAIAAMVALSLVQVPLIARASIEAFSRVPPPLREAADALGVARWRTVLGVILPAGSNIILTATILSIARVAGETAPVLLTASTFQQGYAVNPVHAVPSMPLEILNLFESGYPAAVAKAWGAAFLLMFVILMTNVGARLWLRASERKRGTA